MLYVLIVLGVLGAAGAVYFVIKAVKGDSVSMPKAPPKRTGGGKRGGGLGRRRPDR